jgi:hypothetical protein
MQDDAIEMESNMMASRKLTTRFEIGIREPNQFKELGGPLGSGRNAHDEKIEEMNKLIKDMFGPHIENDKDSMAPFYITITVHDQLLHNCMLDSGASHNLMPKVIMDKLGLQITRTYQDLYSFDSRKVKCLSMIKDLVVNLAQILVKHVLMDVVVVDVPGKFGMLLSRSWGAKLGGSVQLNMTYTTYF